METTLYHRRKDGRVKIWMCQRNGNHVSQSWGEVDGKIQTTTHVVKGNDRRTADERAQHRFNRLIEHRQRKGWVPNYAKIADTVHLKDNEMNFDQLPRHFAPAKPIKKFSMKDLHKWDTAGLLFIERKYDGMRHRIVSDSRGRIRIYSSSNADVTDVLAPLVTGLVLPKKTLLDVELVVLNRDGSDSFKDVSSIARSLPARAHKQIAALQKAGKRVQLLAFDILFEAGCPTYRFDHQIRRGAMNRILSRPGRDHEVLLIPILDLTFDEAKTVVGQQGWEGLVVWRRDQATVVRMNGSPDRCNCWKVKFVKEEDVVATGYELGRGRNAKVVGKLKVAERRGSSMLSMGKCGTGLSDKDREEALRWKYPCVIQIEYDSKTSKGFRFPVFIRKRDDKKVTDV